MRGKILKAFKKSVNNKLGRTIGLAANMKPHDMDRLLTGSLNFDVALGGGVPVGRLTIFRGAESCISGDSFLRYDVVSMDGEVVNKKGGTIRRLYERFSGELVDASDMRGKVALRGDVDFYVKSVNHDGCIVRNKVLDVVRTGVKMCYRVEVSTGEFLISTMDHKYMTPDGFSPLGELKVGSKVFVHNNTRKVGRKKATTRNGVCVKYHPIAPVKIVHCSKMGKDYPYRRIQKSRMVYEAFLNGMSFEKYRDFLNTKSKTEIDGLVVLPDHIHVHHEDEDFNNNGIDNLRLIDPSEHGALHIVDRLANLSFVVAESEITKIERVGEFETYDLKCAYPYNNYVANGLVVHNSGKTTQALRVGAIAQKLCANCLRFVDDITVVETGFDEDTGEIEYEAHGTCDCYKNGIFKPVPYPEDFSNREKGTHKQIEVEVTDEKTGKTKNKKTTAFKERIKRYEENSYEEFRVAFFDHEGTLDLAWAKRVGVDTRLLLVVDPSTAEEGIDLYDEMMRTGAIDLFILDSVAAMTPSIEVEASTEDEQRAAQAKLINKFVRKVTASVIDVKRDFGKLVTQIWINQERMSMAKFGPGSIMPAGMGQKFGSSVIVSMWPSNWEKETFDSDLKKNFQLEVGKEVQMNFKIIKNKTAASQATGSYVMRVVGARQGMVEELKYVLDQAMKYGLFREKKDGSKKTWFVGDEEFQKKGSALARIENPEVFDKMKKVLMKYMLEGIDAEE